jgi:glycosyltransferase involved in cell wall biosynthesis
MAERSKIGIVVHRWHPSVIGGSEALAWHYATLLVDKFDVDLLTTTATDAVLWKDELPSGIDWHDGVRVVRFSVTRQRTAYWHSLHEFLIADVRALRPGSREYLDHRDDWTMALQREFIAKQGPYSPDFFRFLEERHSDYAALIFVTYLYPTTFFGLEAVRGHPNTLLAPTLHDEPPAHLSAYRNMAREFDFLLWNTPAERRLTYELWGPAPGGIVSMAIDSVLVETTAPDVPYILYSGRIDSHKGCREMFDYFIEFKKRHPSPLQLKLTGIASMKVPEHPDINFLGFVSANEKTQLMRNAAAFIMPSENESLSIVTLEAMAQETPVLANANGRVVTEHIRNSRGGMLFTDRETFVRALAKLTGNEDGCATAMGRQAREYVITDFSKDVIRQRLIESVTRNRQGDSRMQSA